VAALGVIDEVVPFRGATRLLFNLPSASVIRLAKEELPEQFHQAVRKIPTELAFARVLVRRELYQQDEVKGTSQPVVEVGEVKESSAFSDRSSLLRLWISL
jgi:hypothetical protein